MTPSVAGVPQGVQPSLLSNSRWNLLGFACGLLANFVTLPFVVRWIGLSEFGHAGLVLAVTAPLTLVGTVIGQALVREMAARRGAGDAAGAQRTCDAALRLSLIAGVLGWAALVLAGPWITLTILGSDSPRDGLRLSFMIAAAGWLAQQLCIVLQGASAGRQDFRSVARVAAFSGIATVAATLALTSAFPTVDGYLAGVATSFGLTLACWLLVQRGSLRVRAIARDDLRTELRALLHFGKWQGLAQLAGAFGNQIDRYALGALTPVAVVGQYNVANRLQEAAYIGVVKGGEVLFPHFGSLASRSVEERGRVFQVSSWVVATFSAMLLVPLVPLAASVLALWIGPQVGSDTAFLLRTLVLGGIVGCGSNVFVYYAMGMGRNAPVAWISLMYSAATVLFTVLLIRAYGPLAAGAGLLVASVGRVAASLVVTRRQFFPQLGWGELLVSSVLPLAVGVALALGVHHTGYAQAHHWASLIAQYAGLAALVLASTLLLSMLTPSGRDIVARTLASLRARGAT